MSLKSIASDANLQWLVLVLERHNINHFNELIDDVKLGAEIIEVISNTYAIKAFMDDFLIHQEKFTGWSTTAIKYFKSRCEVVYCDSILINRNLDEGQYFFPNSQKDWKHRLFVIRKIKNFWLKKFLAS